MRKLLIILSVLGFVACSTGEKKSTETQSAKPVQVVETSLSIGGMTCEHCVMSVTKGLTEVAGVESAVVTLDDSTAVVKYNAAATDIDKLKAAVEKRGYRVKSAE